jgi:hypothetical protein
MHKQGDELSIEVCAIIFQLNDGAVGGQIYGLARKE